MAGAGAKKRIEENKRHVNILRIWLACGFTTYLFVRLIWHGASATTWNWVALALTTLLNYACFAGISSLAAPVYGDKGELLDGGADLKMKGFCGYYHDVLYLTSIIQCGASLFSWFWYLYLLVPLYGLVKLTQHVILPWWTSSSAPQAGGTMDEETRKKMDRAEKRAKARAQKWR